MKNRYLGSIEAMLWRDRVLGKTRSAAYNLTHIVEKS